MKNTNLLNLHRQIFWGGGVQPPCPQALEKRKLVVYYAKKPRKSAITPNFFIDVSKGLVGFRGFERYMDVSANIEMSYAVPKVRDLLTLLYQADNNFIEFHPKLFSLSMLLRQSYWSVYTKKCIFYPHNTDLNTSGA